MKKLGGWQRLFLVFSIATALIFTVLGIKEYQAESRSINSSSHALVSGIVPPDRKLNDMEKFMLGELRERQESNLVRRMRDYGILWLLSLLIFASCIGVIKFVYNGFKSTKENLH